MKSQKKAFASTEAAELEMVKSEIRQACITMGFFPIPIKSKPAGKKENHLSPKS